MCFITILIYKTIIKMHYCIQKKDLCSCYRQPAAYMYVFMLVYIVSCHKLQKLCSAMWLLDDDKCTGPDHIKER